MSEATVKPQGRLLVVDDEASLVTALVSTLRDEGYTVSGASNPTDALETLRRERFDVVFTDLNLPEMDGIAFLRAALAIDSTMGAIVMTGHGSIDSAVDAMKVGAVDYVLKPFKLKSVLAILARALAVRRLRHENEALQRRLASRTEELEAANKELEAFAYSVSHDLRAPLRTIGGFTDALVEEALAGSTANLEGYRQRIQKGVTRMWRMIDDLLGMAKAVRAEVHWSDVDLASLAADAVEKLRAAHPDRRVELLVAPGLVTQGDPGLLGLAMENLLSNAWKYSVGRDPAKIEIGVQGSGAEKVYFVRDNGVGFDMAESDRLFVPFQRLTSGGHFEGTGVGLATVQRIVQRHGGKIWGVSELDRGATFLFTIPSAAERSKTPESARLPLGDDSVIGVR